MEINVLGTPLKAWTLALGNPAGVPSATITQLRGLLGFWAFFSSQRWVI